MFNSSNELLSMPEEQICHGVPAVVGLVRYRQIQRCHINDVYYANYLQPTPLQGWLAANNLAERLTSSADTLNVARLFCRPQRRAQGHF
ncbi:hypothetical protein HMPREF0758_4053 [Serratia odorifera DSM 4582]|uniref:Uncharacterized protein n=1 Tax=Serratia odorifera DSM 4582 TaxID=667129 RepID=D4E7A3_SEROD|nr:hypothetical protein HMPREF0758_4053 [Serratia odorifera DSM 4582]